MFVLFLKNVVQFLEIIFKWPPKFRLCQIYHTHTHTHTHKTQNTKHAKTQKRTLDITQHSTTDYNNQTNKQKQKVFRYVMMTSRLERGLIVCHNNFACCHMTRVFCSSLFSQDSHQITSESALFRTPFPLFLRVIEVSESCMNACKIVI